MKKTFFIAFGLMFVMSLFAQERMNVLSEKEKKQGWVLLFNGENLNGWTAVGKTTPPDKGWVVENGTIITNKGGTARGGDLITKDEYGEFDFCFEYKLSKGANSGVKYFFYKYGDSWLGNEYQAIDEEFHPDRATMKGVHKTAALYDLFEVTGKRLIYPHNEWNKGRVVAKGNKVTHYLNGKKVLTYDRKSPKYNEAVKQSKFKDAKPVFGTVEKGYILLQDHQDEVYFRNIKIKDLSKK